MKKLGNGQRRGWCREHGAAHCSELKKNPQKDHRSLCASGSLPKSKFFQIISPEIRSQDFHSIEGPLAPDTKEANQM